MTVDRSLPQCELVRLPDADLRALERATSKLSDTVQRQAAQYQRQADRMRKELKRRKRGVVVCGG